MFLRLRAAPLALAAALLAAPLLTSPARADTDNRLLLGLQMSFGRQVTPEVFTGIVHANHDADGKTSGVKGLVYWDFRTSLAPSKAKVMAILPGRSWQGEVGAGYSFENGNGLFSAGATDKHLTGGVDFSPTTGLSPYIGLQVPSHY